MLYRVKTVAVAEKERNLKCPQKMLRNIADISKGSEHFTRWKRILPQTLLRKFGPPAPNIFIFDQPLETDADLKFLGLREVRKFRKTQIWFNNNFHKDE